MAFFSVSLHATNSCAGVSTRSSPPTRLVEEAVVVFADQFFQLGMVCGRLACSCEQDGLLRGWSAEARGGRDGESRARPCKRLEAGSDKVGESAWSASPAQSRLALLFYERAGAYKGRLMLSRPPGALTAVPQAPPEAMARGLALRGQTANSPSTRQESGRMPEDQRRAKGRGHAGSGQVARCGGCRSPASGSVIAVRHLAYIHSIMPRNPSPSPGAPG